MDLKYTQQDFDDFKETYKDEFAIQHEKAIQEEIAKIPPIREDFIDKFHDSIKADIEQYKSKFSKLLHDVALFHRKFEIPINETPGFCTAEAMKFRADFIQEEFDEFKHAIETNDLPEAFDALIDIVYIALGTVDMMGLTTEEFCELWNDVVRANMSKVRSTGDDDPLSKRKSSFDVVKPADFVPARSIEITESIINNRKNKQEVQFHGKKAE